MKSDNGNGNSGSPPHVFGRPNGDPITLETGLFDQGFRQAQDRGIDQASPEDEEILSAFAEAAAECNSAASYDPTGNPADRLMEEARERNLAELAALEQQAAHARADLRDRERELAACGRHPVEPAAPLMVALFGVLGISVTMTLTLHDIIFAKLFQATHQALLAAGLCGAVLSGLVVWGMLDGARYETSRATHCVLIAICLLFGAALLALRLGGAGSDLGKWIACGFAALELAALLMVEVHAQRLGRAWRRWDKEQTVFAVAEERVNKERTYLDGRLADRDGCRARLREHDEAVAERESLVKGAARVRESARRAILMGYRHGIAANQGHLHGRAARRPTKEEVLEQLSEGIPLENHPLPKKEA